MISLLAPHTPQRIHQKILLAVFSKYIQNLTISYYVYQYYRSRPPWFLASHQCNCLLIAFLPLQSRQSIFFFHHELYHDLQNLLCTRYYTQWFISITYFQSEFSQSVQSAFSRLRSWNEIPYPGSHSSSLKELDLNTLSPRLFPSIQLLMNNMIFTPRKSLSQSCLMKSMQSRV